MVKGNAGQAFAAGSAWRLRQEGQRTVEWAVETANEEESQQRRNYFSWQDFVLLLLFPFSLLPFSYFPCYLFPVSGIEGRRYPFTLFWLFIIKRCF